MPNHQHKSHGHKQHEHAKPNASATPGPRPFWSGSVSFGLVSMPVQVYAGTRAGGVSLRMLAADGTPLSRRYFCPDDDVEVPNEDLVRGYEVADGTYITVTDEELAALEPEKSRDIDLQLFVPASAIDPVYFERSFFLAPAGDSVKAYRLLADVMQRSNRVGVATFVMRDKEYLVAIAAKNGLLYAEALRFHDEVRSIDRVGLPKRPDIAPDVVKHFESLIKRHASKSFDPSALRDESAESLRELVSEKQRKKQDIVEREADEPSEARADIADLMQILKRSLRDNPKTPSKPSAETHAHAAKGPARTGPRRSAHSHAQR